jgi:hypothetical protein
MYITSPFLSNLGYLGQAGRKGSIPWGRIKSIPHLFMNPRFVLKTATLGNPMRIQLQDVTAYWRALALSESKGDPFFFYHDEEEAGQRKGKGKGRQVEEDEEEEEQEGEDQDGEDQDGEDQDGEDQDGEDQDGEDQDGEDQDGEGQDKIPVAPANLPKPPTPDFEIDEGIILPSQSEDSTHKIACLHMLTPWLGEEGEHFHSLVNRVAALEVSAQLLVISMSYSHY